MSTSQLTNQSPAARRTAEAEVSRLVSSFAPAHERLVRAMRRSLRKRLPAANEVVHEYKDFFVISYSPTEHGYEGVLALRASADGVRLYFNRGKELPDPEESLRGSANARWIALENASTLARPAVVHLIDEAIAHNEVPFATTSRGAIIIRSAKPRMRRPA